MQQKVRLKPGVTSSEGWTLKATKVETGSVEQTRKGYLTVKLLTVKIIVDSIQMSESPISWILNNHWGTMQTVPEQKVFENTLADVHVILELRALASRQSIQSICRVCIGSVT